MARKGLLLFLVLCITALFGVAAHAEEANLLTNGGFEDLDAQMQPKGWQRGMWTWDIGISELSVVPDAYSGAACIMVQNVGENDARYEQTVRVNPNTTYRLRCMVKAQAIDADKVGANLSVPDVFDHSAELHDTQGQWVPLEFYGRTGDGQRELTVMARVGFYGSTSKGSAWFDDFSVTEVAEAPAGVTLISFAKPDPVDNPPPVVEPGGEQAEADPLRFTPLILCIACAFLLIMGLCIYRRRRGQLTFSANVRHIDKLLLMLLGIALLLRFIIAGIIKGYGVDIGCFTGWSFRMAETGPWGFYSADYFCDYPPGYMLMLWPVGGLMKLFHLPYDGPSTWIMLKTLPMLADIAAAWLLYRYAQSHTDKNTSALLAVFYVLNPAVILNSAAWGQIDSILVLFLMIAICELMRKRYRVALISFVVAMLIKPQALMFGPFGLLFLVMEVVWKPKHERPALIRELLLSLAMALGVFVLVALPFSVNQSPSWLFTLYGKTMASYEYATVNACNIYELFGLNWVPRTEYFAMFTYGDWGQLAIIVSIAISGYLYYKSRERGRIFLVSATMLMGIFAFGASMHERYMFPALMLVVLAYIMDRDKRLLAAMIAISASLFLNVSLVLQNQHLHSGQAALNHLVSLTVVGTSLLLFYTSFDICVRGKRYLFRVAEAAPGATKPGVKGAPAVSAPQQMRTGPQMLADLLRPRDYKIGMKRVDWIIMLGMTLVYAFIALYNLGSRVAPETQWMSTAKGENIVFDLGEVKTFDTTYHGRLSTTTFTLAFSDDGVNYSDEQMAQFYYDQQFSWQTFQPSVRREGETGKFNVTGESGRHTARYIRLTAEQPGLVLDEIAFMDPEMNILPVTVASAAGGYPGRENDPVALIDEPQTVQPHSFYTGMYFDEIYHARTGYEYLNGLHAYETSHPPLGKVIISFGIWLFGMNPFGWRIMGTLFGILMVPAMYLLTKQLFKRTEYATLGALMMTFDFMHFAQTRIATIDSYGVFFIMLMYLFMFRYSQMNFFRDKFRSSIIVLWLCGISMGIGMACKWIDVYAAVGLAVLFFLAMYWRFDEYLKLKKALPTLPKSDKVTAAALCESYKGNVLVTLANCVLCFVVVPALIYYFSYYWQARADNGLSLSYVLKQQSDMFGYHSNLGSDNHPFASPWYQWPLIIKPMWYYGGGGDVLPGYASSIASFGNPAVWWVSFAALIGTAVMFVRRHDRWESGAAWLLVGFLSQYMPWVLVPRSMFIYHYFASVPFIILCTVYMFSLLRVRWPKVTMRAGIAYAAIVVALFAVFYPAISGFVVKQAYMNALHLFKSWYF